MHRELVLILTWLLPAYRLLVPVMFQVTLLQPVLRLLLLFSASSSLQLLVLLLP
jgi:hypothetical protein